MKNKKLKFAYLLFAIGIFVACNNAQKEEKNYDTPVEGDMILVADESLQPIVEAQVQGYEMAYPKTKIHVKFVPEQKAINLMLNDSARVAIVTRELNEKELEVFKVTEIPYTPAIMALDGVALICNKNNADTMITVKELTEMFNGNLKKDTKLVFDNSSSSNLNYMIKKLGIKDVKKANIFAAKGNKDVIEYVKNNTNAIGIIGANWISDLDDKKSKNFQNSIRVLSVADKENPKKTDFYKPNQLTLAERKYPFERRVYLHTKEARWGLGKGFIRYCCFQVGQLIVEKMGLLPYYKFPRDIEIVRKPQAVVEKK